MASNYLKTREKIKKALKKHHITANQTKGELTERISQKDLAAIITDYLEIGGTICKNPNCTNILEGFRTKYCSDSCSDKMYRLRSKAH